MIRSATVDKLGNEASLSRKGLFWLLTIRTIAGVSLRTKLKYLYLYYRLYIDVHLFVDLLICVIVILNDLVAGADVQSPRSSRCSLDLCTSSSIRFNFPIHHIFSVSSCLSSVSYV